MGALARLGIAIAGFGIACGPPDAPVVNVPPAPIVDAAAAPARPGAVRETIHGVSVDDPFRAFEDDKNENTRAFAARAKDKLEAYFKAVPGREALEKDIASVLHIGSVGMPAVRFDAKDKPRYFHTKRTGTQNQPTLYVRDQGGADRPLLDGNTLSTDGTVAIDWWYPSWDGTTVAWGKSESGSEESTLVMRDVATGKDKGETITRTRHASVAWLPNGKGFYYSRYPAPGSVPAGDEKYYEKIYRHTIGDDPEKDPLVFGGDRDKTDVSQVMISPNGRWLVVRVHMGWAKSEVFLRDLQKGDKAPWIEVAVKTDALFDPIVRDDKLYIMTNDHAPRYRLFAVDYTKPDRTNWKEVISEDGEDTLTDVVVLPKAMVATYLRKAATAVVLFDADGKKKQEIKLPGLGTSHITAPHKGSELFFDFVSYVAPPRVLALDLAAAAPKNKAGTPTVAELAPKVWDEVAPDFAAADVKVTQITATSKDGTQIPMFVVAKDAAPGSGPRSTLLWGYGGFNVNQTPAFSSRALVMARRGGVFVSSVLRGGGEMGEGWHRAGMLEKKQNVFDDFIACAEELIRQGITSPDKLAIGGGSNGGLLTSVAITQRPELFRAALSLVPLTDMVRYTRFQIAQLWIPEYGDPARPADFSWLYAYSPYHHVTPHTAYPSVLLTTAESDTRVDPMHARKMAARLEEAQSRTDRPILLRIESKAGHGAGKPVSKVLAQTADELAFVLHETGAL